MKLDKLPSDFAEEMNRAYQEDIQAMLVSPPEPLGARLDARLAALRSAINSRMGVKQHAARLGSVLVMYFGCDDVSPQLQIPGTERPGDTELDALDESQRMEEIQAEGESTATDPVSPRKPKRGH